VTLPVLLSIPHGGTAVPTPWRERMRLTPRELFADGDACTPEIYDLGDAVAAVVQAEVARALVDLNRAPDDRPPANPDGVVKTTTAYGRPIWRDGVAPSPDEADTLIATYHAPYHGRLAALAAREGVVLGLDCHSMAAVAPPAARGPGAPRPPFCLSDRDGRSAPSALVARVREALATTFGLSTAEVAVNTPFQGGYIVARHGGAPIPWLQVEMSRAWYLTPPWFDEATLTVDAARLRELRERFHRALELLAL
jgi:N-formylglutamate deformylase